LEFGVYVFKFEFFFFRFEDDDESDVVDDGEERSLFLIS
jgi:hypothetical protein